MMCHFFVMLIVYSVHNIAKIMSCYMLYYFVFSLYCTYKKAQLKQG